MLPLLLLFLLSFNSNLFLSFFDLCRFMPFYAPCVYILWAVSSQSSVSIQMNLSLWSVCLPFLHLSCLPPSPLCTSSTMCVFRPTATVWAVLFFITPLVNSDILFKQVHRLTHKAARILHTDADSANSWDISAVTDCEQLCQSLWRGYGMSGSWMGKTWNLNDKSRTGGFYC